MSTSKKFEYTVLEEDSFMDYPQVNLSKLYEQACAELTLQQSKRDILINIYLLMFSFLVPFVFSLDSEAVSLAQKGVILMASGVIGVLFSMIIVRYRIYKEAYWLTCETITRLTNLKSQAFTKCNVQSVFYDCMEKKWGKMVRKKDGKKYFCHYKFFKSNVFSAESLYYIVISFLTTVVTSIGLYMMMSPLPSWRLYIVIGFALVMFARLVWRYFHYLEKVFGVLVDGSEDSFNFAFSKAWFLHFYRD